MIQKQTWKDEIRILITDEENLGSVQILIPLYVSDIFGKADALIYALFVDKKLQRSYPQMNLLKVKLKVFQNEQIVLAIMALLFIALFPVTILIIAGILMYFGMNSVLALLIGAVVALFIIITIDVYHQQGN